MMQTAEETARFYADLDAAIVALVKAARPMWGLGDGYGGMVIDRLLDAFEAGGCPGPPPAPTSSRASIPVNVRAIVYARDGLRCVHCGATDPLTIDHIIPIVAGGTDDLENLQTLCGPCNYRKGDRPDPLTTASTTTQETTP